MKILRNIVILAAFAALAACGGDGSGGSDAYTDTGSLCTDGEQQDCTTTENYQGKMVCQNGAWSTCAALCGDGDQAPCTTVCDSKGTMTCTNGNWGTCQPPAEECNGKDDDCDGQIDEELGDNTCGEGECAHNSPKCENGVLMPCNPFEGASAETCDSKDNTCDGQTDEGLIQECNTACGQGIEKCVGGQWKDCSAPAVQDEVCDGKDNDCNGQADDGISCSCTVPDAKACGTDEGECMPGVQNCEAGTWGPCGGAGYVGPANEMCNNQDDNCDGQTDEGLTQDCQTACGTGKEVCEGGDWVNCTAPVPSDEVCDGFDNDCNDLVDDGLDADDWENNETCALARDLGEAKENAGVLEFQGTIYTGSDVDWYSIDALEISDIIPPCWEPGLSDPCYIAQITLTGIPQGVDYDLTVLTGDCDGVNGIFESVEAGQNPEFVGIGWPGMLGFDDSEKLYIQVMAKQSEMESCFPYTLTVDFYGVCPDTTTGLCPWESASE